GEAHQGLAWDAGELRYPRQLICRRALVPHLARPGRRRARDLRAPDSAGRPPPDGAPASRRVPLRWAQVSRLWRYRLDRLGRSPFFDGWKSCPRCPAGLSIVDARATCPECGLVVYANPGPTVSALPLDADGRILLARRAADPGRGLWDLLGGFAGEGEGPLEPLSHQHHWETGVEIEPLEFFGAWPDRYGEGGVWTLNLYWTA